MLVVDDDAEVCALAAAVLRDEGYVVVTAPDAAAGLAALDGEPVDLVLLDIRMPRIDGWDFLAACRQRPGPQARVIVFTADVSAADQATNRGADGALTKPFELDDLLHLVARYAGPS